MAVEQIVEYAGKSLQSGDAQADVSGEFVDLHGERFYAIRNVDKMPPFFISVISDDDHWLFVSSTGGLTAGRVSPDTALFPYITVDRIHEAAPHTGSLTLLRVQADDGWHAWRPFSDAQNADYVRSRHIYKNTLGNKLCFEEINHDLNLAFRYTWVTSARYGFVRQAELENLGDTALSVDMLDGLQNILPAGTPRFTQTNSSNLVDAYKWNEYDSASGLALFTLYSGITDRAEPCESLKANVAFCLGLDDMQVLISTEQLARFGRGHSIDEENLRRGLRGAFLINSDLTLSAGSKKTWQIVVNTEQTQSDVIELRQALLNRPALDEAIQTSIAGGSAKLRRIMASADALQLTAEETVSAHHYANVLFNVLRGGVFFDQNNVDAGDLRQTIRSFNGAVYARHQTLLAALPDTLSADVLLARVEAADDPQLVRLCREYLPITFGRRHGDPSRPWNQFAIRLRDANGNTRLSYEGNWRDIFQNWEALALSFPNYVESMIAKFVNASTVDGYNPYRITKEGIDWEVEEPDDPWSYIGYWGDHQIIYLQKLLELSRQYHPQQLGDLLLRPLYSYANVPYKIRSFADLLADPKNTVDFDDALAARIDERIARLGSDGRLLLNADGDVIQVSLLEKLLVPMLAKLGNLVIDGGIWMNTQRPEWNDANNALVGHGLSMVTLSYLRRYMEFLHDLLPADTSTISLSKEVAIWLDATSGALARIRPQLNGKEVSADERLRTLTELGEAASRFRDSVYKQEGFSGEEQRTLDDIRSLLNDALHAVDHSIQTNRRSDRLYHAYNLLEVDGTNARVERMYPMLEGQVAALSAGTTDAKESIEILEALFDSAVYRPDQQSFMLYPDRDLPGFLDKNRINAEAVETISLLGELLAAGNEQLVVQDATGSYRFNANIVNAGTLDEVLDAMQAEFGASKIEAARQSIQTLYEQTFDHQAFTGRSGTMFGFEGLGCIYWHMVAKLLVAVQENFFRASDAGGDAETIKRLGELYYHVRHGLGFNKTPVEFGAFPTDPYSHTPRHAGARQPGMTGQVKEELLTRFGELGVRIVGGQVRFQPDLLRPTEFLPTSRSFSYIDVANNEQKITVPANALAFTWCQIPIVYRLSNDNTPQILLTANDGTTRALSSLTLPTDLSAEAFARSGNIQRLDITLNPALLFAESTDES